MSKPILPVALAALLLAVPSLTAPAFAGELVCRPNYDFCVEVDGKYPHGATFLTADVRGKFLVDIPSNGSGLLIDLPARKAVAHRQRHHDGLLCDNLPFDAGIFELQAAEAHIDSARLQGLDLLDRGQLRQAHVDFRLRVAKAPDHLGQRTVQRRRHEADAEPGAIALRDAAGGDAHFGHPLEQLHRLPMEELAGGREPQRTCPPVDQFGTEFFLQLANLSAQRRLRDVQLIGGAAEGELAGHGGEGRGRTRA